MNKMDERILAISRDYLFNNEVLTFQGVISPFSEWSDHYKYQAILNRFWGWSEVRRGDVENDDGYKQPIPYVVVRRGEDIYTYKRLEGGGETRLHNQVSIGVGGHMNDIFSGMDFRTLWSKLLVENAKRELDEELYISGGLHESDFTIQGLINDDAGDAGLYHIGILMVIDLEPTDTVEVREFDQLDGEWVHISELNEVNYPNLESWTKMVLESGVLKGKQVEEPSIYD